MGLGDKTPSRVTNNSSKSVLCFASHPQGWNAHILDPGFTSPVWYDIDGVKQLLGGPIILRYKRFSSDIPNDKDTWWKLSGAFGLFSIEDKGKDLLLNDESGTLTSISLMKDKILEDQNGGQFPAASPWPKPPNKH